MASGGSVALVGAGPGDPMLLTLAGLEALRSADVVVYDKLVPHRLLEWSNPSAEQVFVGKQAGNVYLPQSEINDLLVRLAREGKRVVRLKGGDPLIFARGAEEMEALASAGIDYEIIPGVTAALGSAATSAIPLTHRGDASVVTFVTGHDDPSKPEGVDWAGIAKHAGTIVIYMARSKIGSICQSLVAGGMAPSTPAAFIQWGGSNRQKVHVLSVGEATTGAPADIGTPMLAIIGSVVHYREALQWLEKRPLFGQAVLVVRSLEQSESISRKLEQLGAEALVEPVIRIEPPEDWGDVDAAIADLRSVDWLVFSSRNGVRFFLDRLKENGLDARTLANVQIAAIGPGTAEELSAYFLRADLVPAEFRAESLAADLKSRVAGKRLLLVRANRGRTVLEDELGPIASHVRSIVAYRQVDVDQPHEETMSRLRLGEIGWVLLTSSNIARGFFRWLDEGAAQIVRERMRIVSISPITSQTIRECGFDVAVEAAEFTLDGMVQSMLGQLG